MQRARSAVSLSVNAAMMNASAVRSGFSELVMGVLGVVEAPGSSGLDVVVVSVLVVLF